MKQSKNFQFKKLKKSNIGKFKKFEIWKIAEIFNLENSKNLPF